MRHRKPPTDGTEGGGSRWLMGRTVRSINEGLQTSLARAEETTLAVIIGMSGDEAQVPLAVILAETRTKTFAVLVLPNLAAGHDEELPLEIAGSLVRADEAEFHGPFRLEIELIQLPQELGPPGIRVVLDDGAEAHEHKFPIGVAGLGPEPSVSDPFINEAVELHRVSGIDKRSVVVLLEDDRNDGQPEGLRHAHPGRQRGVESVAVDQRGVGGQQLAQQTTIDNGLHLVAFDLIAVDQIQHFPCLR